MKDSRVNRENALLILEWCFNKLGKSRFHKKHPKLIILNKISKINLDVGGWYDDNKNIISIVVPNQKTFIDFIDTVIHEFWHYKQNPKGYKYVYNRINWGENEIYKNDPSEISARNKAKKYKKQCYNDLFNN